MIIIAFASKRLGSVTTLNIRTHFPHLTQHFYSDFALFVLNFPYSYASMVRVYQLSLTICLMD